MNACPDCPVTDGDCAATCPGGEGFCRMAATEAGRRHVVARSKHPCPGMESVETAAERRARKPKIALGARQRPIPGCSSCAEAAAALAAEQARR